jgi:hypothetical protein
MNAFGHVLAAERNSLPAAHAAIRLGTNVFNIGPVQPAGPAEPGKP